MFHAPVKRIVPGAPGAVLFVHGILSTPRYYDDFLPSVPEGWSVSNVLLPGHGGTVQAFGRSSMAAWQAHVDAELEELCSTHERVYVVAHSLGTLLTLESRACREGRIAEMLLLAVPIRIRVKPGAFVHNLLKGVGLAEQDGSLRTYYGTDQDWRVWRYVRWIPRYLELFARAAQVRRKVSAVRVPARVFLSGKDELVSPRVAQDLALCPAMQVQVLPDSSHHAYGDADKALLQAELRAMCQGE